MPFSVGGVAASQAAPAATQAAPAANQADSAMSALSGIGSDGFLKLLVAQLRYQSPLEPSDPGDMMLQTAQLAQLDATQQMVSMQRRDMGLQQAVMAAGLIGTDVTAAASDGSQVQGVVEGVRYTQAGPVLEVGGREVALDDVTELRRATTDA